MIRKEEWNTTNRERREGERERKREKNRTSNQQKE